MRGKIAVAGFILGLCGIAASAQVKPVAAYPNDVYCSGVVTNEQVPRDAYVITGEESSIRMVYSDHDRVFINKGSSQSVKVGDEFSVIRPVEDSVKVEWTKWQTSILKKMGTMWEDEGRLKVAEVRPDLSIAQVVKGCGYMQRGDIVLPFVERPEPPLKPAENIDRFAPADGKPTAMVIMAQRYMPQAGRNDIVYVNLGNGQGVKVGDYYRIFRYTGTQHEEAYQTPDYAFDLDGNLGPTYGYGSVSKKFNWSNVPREVLGEGVVLRTGPNSSTVLITFSAREIFAGDYVEIE